MREGAIIMVVDKIKCVVLYYSFSNSKMPQSLFQSQKITVTPPVYQPFIALWFSDPRFPLCSRVKLSPGMKTAINQALFRGIFLYFLMPDAACYMKCPRRIFHGDSAIVYSKGTGVSLSSTGVLLFECL